MVDKEKKKDMEKWTAAAPSDENAEEEFTPSRRNNETRNLRKIDPLGMRVVVRIRKEADQTEAGLYLPEGAKNEMRESLVGEVLEVASAIDDETDEEANISGIPEGALVLLPKDAGIKVPWDDDLRIVETSDVLAIVHEVSLS